LGRQNRTRGQNSLLVIERVDSVDNVLQIGETHVLADKGLCDLRQRRAGKELRFIECHPLQGEGGAWSSGRSPGTRGRRDQGALDTRRLLLLLKLVLQPLVLAVDGARIDLGRERRRRGLGARLRGRAHRGGNNQNSKATVRKCSAPHAQ